MKKRCLNPKNKFYKNYGGSGVKICKEWVNRYESFLEWAIENGWKPGLCLDKDRKGNGKLYSAKTCCWITQKDNANKRGGCVYYYFKGKRMTITEIADIVKISRAVLYRRVNINKQTIQEAISIPVKEKGGTKRFLYDGFLLTIKEIASMEKLDYEVVRGRFKYYKYKNISKIIKRLKERYQ